MRPEPALPIDRERDGWAWREAAPPQASGLAVDVPPLVLLHGLGGSRLSWEPQLAEIGRVRRVLAWDLPGYGAAAALGDGGPVTFDELAAAVHAFVDVATGQPGSSFHLAGISFGGMIAQYVAASRPDRVRSLTLLATSPKFGLDGTSPEAWRAARLAPLDDGQEPGDFAERVVRSLAGRHLGPDALAGQVAAMRRITGAALRRSIDVLVTHDSREVLGSITAPTVCMVGADDVETPVDYAEAIAERIAGARVIVVREAGHLLNVEAPAIVDRVLTEQIEAGGTT
jgi:pimeloyl-ACP methyl ester carboxylesterase